MESTKDGDALSGIEPLESSTATSALLQASPGSNMSKLSLSFGSYHSSLQSSPKNPDQFRSRYADWIIKFRQASYCYDSCYIKIPTLTGPIFYKYIISELWKLYVVYSHHQRTLISSDQGVEWRVRIQAEFLSTVAVTLYQLSCRPLLDSIWVNYLWDLEASLVVESSVFSKEPRSVQIKVSRIGQ